MVIACLGFLNYVLLRVYGSKGIYVTAMLGGLVNSTATAAELVSTLSGSELIGLVVPGILLTSVSMFLRNLLILAIFARGAIRTAALPLIAMELIAAYWIYRDRHKAADVDQNMALDLGSPVRSAKSQASRCCFSYCRSSQRWDSGSWGTQVFKSSAFWAVYSAARARLRLPPAWRCMVR